MEDSTLNEYNENDVGQSLAPHSIVVTHNDIDDNVSSLSRTQQFEEEKKLSEEEKEKLVMTIYTESSQIS